jgi:ABC-type lipoprotein export system ATPase subunit/bifunctional DNA-binding transcriptional regulator/antitoxin component of YhaV-PrlF toxin-antitoxin module
MKHETETEVKRKGPSITGGSEADYSAEHEQAERDKNMVWCDNLVKIYKATGIEVVALQGLDLTVEPGEMMAIIGNSGSGKSTLLNILGGLDRPSAGRVTVGGIDLLKLSDKDLVKYRRDTVGFVWQNNARNLIPYLTALQNVEFPMNISSRKRRNRAKELLDAVGLSHRMHSKLMQLSGGEQQRVAIAIALANEPKMILADEPTGAVDTATAGKILSVLRKLNDAYKVTVIIVTHDMQVSRAVDRVVAIRDGKTSSEFIRRKYSEELAHMEGDISRIETIDDSEHEELIVLDRAGRLQIPREYLEQMHLHGKNKVKLYMEDGKIVMQNPGSSVSAEEEEKKPEEDSEK